MSSAENDNAHKIGLMMRAGRKGKALSQIDIARHLGVTQGYISKIENGLMIPPATQWIDFCHLVEIDADCFYSSHIDKGRTNKVIPAYVKDSAFSLPKRYSYLMGSGVRSSLPFIKLFENVCGQGKFTEYCKAKKIDPDFFVFTDHALNINFNIDLIDTILQKKSLSDDKLHSFLSIAAQPETHGKIYKYYQKEIEPLKRIEFLVNKATKYDVNFKYQVENIRQNSIDFSVLAHDHLKDFSKNVSSTSTQFLDKYRKSYIQQFAFGESRKNEGIIKSVSGKNFLDKTVYQLQLSS